MNKSADSRGGLLALASLIALAAGLTFGCETRVTSATGIGASSTHPNTEQPAGSDPLSKKVWGGKDSQP